MNENIYDYVITSVENPAFEDNIAVMVSNITEAEGTSPTFVKRIKNGNKIPDTDPVEYEQIPIAGTNPMYGTKAANGKIQLHFRLREKLSEPELLTFLEQVMSNPKPAITVCSIRSAFEIIYINDGLDEEGNAIGHYEYDVIMQANKATFLPFMADVTDNNDPENPVSRPPNMTDNLYLSGYYGTESIELV